MDIALAQQIGAGAVRDLNARDGLWFPMRRIDVDAQIDDSAIPHMPRLSQTAGSPAGQGETEPIERLRKYSSRRRRQPRGNTLSRALRRAHSAASNNRPPRSLSLASNCAQCHRPDSCRTASGHTAGPTKPGTYRPTGPTDPRQSTRRRCLRRPLPPKRPPRRTLASCLS